MSKYKLIIEKNKDGYWSQVDKLPSVFSSGETIAKLIENSMEALELYFEESEQKTPKIQFELVMDIQEFFKVNDT